MSLFCQERQLFLVIYLSLSDVAYFFDYFIETVVESNDWKYKPENTNDSWYQLILHNQDDSYRMEPYI